MGAKRQGRDTTTDSIEHRASGIHPFSPSTLLVLASTLSSLLPASHRVCCSHSNTFSTPLSFFVTLYNIHLYRHDLRFQPKRQLNRNRGLTGFSREFQRYSRKHAPLSASEFLTVVIAATQLSVVSPSLTFHHQPAIAAIFSSSSDIASSFSRMIATLVRSIHLSSQKLHPLRTASSPDFLSCSGLLSHNIRPFVLNVLAFSTDFPSLTLFSLSQ